MPAYVKCLRYATTPSGQALDTSNQASQKRAGQEGDGGRMVGSYSWSRQIPRQEILSMPETVKNHYNSVPAWQTDKKGRFRFQNYLKSLHFAETKRLKNLKRLTIKTFQPFQVISDLKRENLIRRLKIFS